MSFTYSCMLQLPLLSRRHDKVVTSGSLSECSRNVERRNTSVGFKYSLFLAHENMYFSLSYPPPLPLLPLLIISFGGWAVWLSPRPLFDVETRTAHNCDHLHSNEELSVWLCCDIRGPKSSAHVFMISDVTEMGEQRNVRRLFEIIEFLWQQFESLPCLSIVELQNSTCASLHRGSSVPPFSLPNDLLQRHQCKYSGDKTTRNRM